MLCWARGNLCATWTITIRRAALSSFFVRPIVQQTPDVNCWNRFYLEMSGTIGINLGIYTKSVVLPSIPTSFSRISCIPILFHLGKTFAILTYHMTMLIKFSTAYLMIFFLKISRITLQPEDLPVRFLVKFYIRPCKKGEFENILEPKSSIYIKHNNKT